jgi:transcriptional regulator with XRE-family HTH domain
MVVREVSMPETLGARLRQRREERGIPLVAIAQQTKIKASLLEGLENDDLSHWPSSLYRRAFVRAYAGAINLDPDTTVQEFLQAHPDPPAVDVIAAMSSVLHRGDGHARRIRKVVGSALESLSRRQRSTAMDDRTAEPVAASTPAVANTPARSAPLAGTPEVITTVQEQATPAHPPAESSSAGAIPAEAAAPDTLGKDREDGTLHGEAQPDLLAVARLCTEFGRVEDLSDVPPLLEEAARLLEAKGLIVWLWDGSTGELTPTLVHGYSDKMVSQLPTVRWDAENLTAAAFRSAQPRTYSACPQSCGALAVPLLTAGGCTGVLALELPRGREGSPSAVAVATILASHLAPMPARVLPAELSQQIRLAVAGV